MFLLFRPSQARIRAFIAAERDAKFSYVEQGASRDGAPAGYTVDHNRVQVGCGADAFARAAAAVRDWKMFDVGWVELCWPDAPIAVGTTVALLVRHFGFWSLNACRVVYVMDEHGAAERFGFAYGTLAGHSEIGEERFTVEMLNDGSVWYDIYAFSRPRGLARLAFPLSRRLQHRFAGDSKAAMCRAVASDRG